MQMRLRQVYKRSHGGNRGSEFEEGVLCRQTCATGLSESTQKTLTLLKSTFKLDRQINRSCTRNICADICTGVSANFLPNFHFRKSDGKKCPVKEKGGAEKTKTT